MLNAQAVEFAKDKGIAIYARATASPLPGADPSADGTVVRRFPPRMPGTVVGVASERDVLVLEAGDGAPARCSPRSTSTRVAGKQLHQIGDGRLTLVVSRENLHEEARAARRRWPRASATRVRVVDDARRAQRRRRRHQRVVREPAPRLGGARRQPASTPRGVATSSFRITWMIDRARGARSTAVRAP